MEQESPIARVPERQGRHDSDASPAMSVAFKTSAYRLNCVKPIGRPLVYAEMSRHFAHISHKDKIRYGDVPGSISVLESLDLGI